jgi:hypothetical protein
MYDIKKGQQLSGNSYVAAYERVNTGERPMPKIPIADVKFCDHTKTICALTTCVLSWELDWVLMFHRTAGGRNLAAAIGRRLTD